MSVGGIKDSLKSVAKRVMAYVKDSGMADKGKRRFILLFIFIYSLPFYHIILKVVIRIKNTYISRCKPT
eukprot:COSAG01_NODE_4586_length_4894_cov_6.028989_6_plen_69_part_00